MPGWVPATTTALSLLGLAVSAYLTVEHFSSGTTLACPDTGAINCVKVTASSYSKLFGVPVALLGLLFFVAMVPLSLPVAWRSRHAGVARLRLLLACVGVLFVLYLVWAELFPIGAICLWCTVVHVVTVTLFGIVVVVAARRP